MKNLKSILIIISFIITTSLKAQTMEKQVNLHGMSVSWVFESNDLIIEMSAPTTGWITVGFNDHDGTNNAYLLMGNIVKDKLSVVEHYTLNAGNYKSFNSLSVSENITIISGSESTQKSTLKFRVSFNSDNKYQKQLRPGDKLYMILAYSREDDFQHHSIWRESIEITL